jgi:Tfp pilus assembly protein PilE
MEQSNLLELAKQGEPSAIAALMNAVLSPKGITARAGIEDDCLCIFLESQKPLNQETLVAFIQKGLIELGNDSIRSVRAQGKRAGDEAFTWTREFSLRSSESTSRIATLTPPIEDELPEIDTTPAIDDDEIEEEEALSFRGWVKKRWRVYALPVALVVIGGFVVGGTTAFWSTSKQQGFKSVEAVMKPQSDSSDAKQKEAETYLKTMTTAQENFYKQNNRFASSLEELERSTNVISQSYSYAYRLRVGTDSVMTAIPREANLQSYISVVSLSPSGTTRIICQSVKPSVQVPEKPKVAKGSKVLGCGARSQPLP